MRLRPIILAVCAILVSALSRLDACTVCFGAPDSDMVKGFTAGIWILLVLPYSLAAGLIALIIYHVRKKNRREELRLGHGQ